MAKANSKLFLVLLLGVLSAFGPFVVDLYLPSLPQLASFFETNASMTQLTLTTAMIGLALGQLLLGPLSDKFGRKKPLIISLVIYIISTVLIVFSPNIETMIVLRVIQGLSSVAPQLAMGLLLVVVAPLGEEIICRAVVPRLVFKGYEKIGYLVGAAVFAYLHGPSNLGSWIIYGGMSLILTWVAYRYKRVEYSILLHLTLNSFAFLVTILLSFLPA